MVVFEEKAIDQEVIFEEEVSMSGLLEGNHQIVASKEEAVKDRSSKIRRFIRKFVIEEWFRGEDHK